MPDANGSAPPDRFVTAEPALPILHPILGRDVEIEQVRALLDGDMVRVVSLLGPGGVGKTRLALEVMRVVANDYLHGVAFVSLAPVRDEALVPFAVAQALGIQESGSLHVNRSLAAWLRTRHFLLVLDNMEQVVEAASPWLTDLLVACPRVKVLVTSRIPLDISSEQRFRVQPLPVPERSAAPSLQAYAAIELFAQRAHAVRADFAPNAGNLEAIAEICIGLDGLPLAIELAAARVNVFSPPEIRSRLTDRLSLLTGNRRDAPLRLRSMRDAIAWSFDLLPAIEQDLFCRLAVFVGGFSFDAAAFVAARGPGGEPAPGLAALIDQSLVERTESTGETRYRMLETMREFGLERLEERGQLDAARDAHAAFYQGMGSQARAGLRGPDQASWLKRLETDYGNLREAMSWLTATDRAPDAVELFSQILYVMLIHAHFSEGRQMLQGWLASADVAKQPRARALALHADALLAANLGHPASAIASLTEALELFQAVGDGAMTIFSLNVLTFAHTISGDPDRAQPVNDQCLPIARQSGDARDLALALTHKGNIRWDGGDPQGAGEALEEGLAVARAGGDHWMVAIALSGLGRLALELDEDPDRALRLIEETRTIQVDLGDKRGLPVTYNDLAMIAQAQGDLDLASSHLRLSAEIAQQTGQDVSEAFAHLDLSAIARLQADFQDSARELRSAFALLQRSPQTVDVAAWMLEAVALALATGDAAHAARFLGASESPLVKREEPPRPSGPADERERLETDARALLGATDYDRCYAEGLTWSQSDAITAVLDWKAPVRDVRHPAESTPAHRLSQRELDVLRLMASGLSNQGIADELYLSRRTVTTHVTNILGKLDLSSRTQAVAFAIRGDLA